MQNVHLTLTHHIVCTPNLKDNYQDLQFILEEEKSALIGFYFFYFKNILFLHFFGSLIGRNKVSTRKCSFISFRSIPPKSIRIFFQKNILFFFFFLKFFLRKHKKKKKKKKRKQSIIFMKTIVF